MNVVMVYFFVEGIDDERFIEYIIKPRLEDNGFLVGGIYKYAQEKQNKVTSFYRNLKKFYTVYFLSDFNNSPCITKRKEYIRKIYNVDYKDIVIVKPEIEAWYLAGVTNKNKRKIYLSRKRKLPKNCEHITKEKFNKYIPKEINRVVFMQKIAENYDLMAAIEKNSSLRRFIIKNLKLIGID